MSKPEGYIAKDVIFGVIDKFRDQKIPFKKIKDEMIQAAILNELGFEEKIKTVSGYKSKYKKERIPRDMPGKAFDPERIPPELLMPCIKISKHIEDAYFKGINKDSLKQVLSLTVDTIYEMQEGK